MSSLSPLNSGFNINIPQNLEVEKKIKKECKCSSESTKLRDSISSNDPFYWHNIKKIMDAAQSVLDYKSSIYDTAKSNRDVGDLTYSEMRKPDNDFNSKKYKELKVLEEFKGEYPDVLRGIMDIYNSRCIENRELSEFGWKHGFYPKKNREAYDPRLNKYWENAWGTKFLNTEKIYRAKIGYVDRIEEYFKGRIGYILPNEDEVSCSRREFKWNYFIESVVTHQVFEILSLNEKNGSSGTNLEEILSTFTEEIQKKYKGLIFSVVQKMEREGKIELRDQQKFSVLEHYSTLKNKSLKKIIEKKEKYQRLETEGCVIL